MAKERWFGRDILEIMSSDFMDRSIEYYRYSLESGLTTINGKTARPDAVITVGDQIMNIVHKHEPPVTTTPVRVLHEDKERGFIVVDKPGSIPVHPTGRYFKTSLTEIMKHDFGYEKVYTPNRLDRLTSGLIILALSPTCARSLTDEFFQGTVKKEYIARVKGCFPEKEVACEQPLLCVDRQIGLNIVHPKGKEAKTIFKRLLYDASSDSSVVHCRPLTGRSHQLRVHLQYLGYPIVNDPIYGDARIWGSNLGKNGVDTTPATLESSAGLLKRACTAEGQLPPSASPAGAEHTHRLHKNAEQSGDRQPHKIGKGSPVPLSSEMIDVLTKMQSIKDEDDNWSRWRDVAFLANGQLMPRNVIHRLLPEHLRPPKRKTRSGSRDTFDVESGAGLSAATCTAADPPHHSAGVRTHMHMHKSLYCPECYAPIRPDPNPESLYIFLHALRYTTSLGAFETETPEWAAEG